MKIKRILATALSVSMLMGQGVYAAETSMNMESEAETVSYESEESTLKETEENIEEDTQSVLPESQKNLDEEMETEAESASDNENQEIQETADLTEETEEIKDYDSATQYIIDGIKYEIIGSQRVEIVGYDSELPDRIIIPEQVKINNVYYTVVSIADYGFERLCVDGLVLPDTITSIGRGAFSMSGVRELIIPKGVTHIREYTFYDSGIRKVVLPENLKTIENYAFCMCTLESIDIPDRVTSIGSATFGASNFLKSVTIPASVKKLETPFFYFEGTMLYGCDSLDTLIMKGDAPETEAGTMVWGYEYSSLSYPSDELVISVPYGAKGYDKFPWTDYKVVYREPEQKLSPTENLKAVSAGKQKVKLTWSAVEGAEGYLVYGQKNGQYGYVGMTTKGTSYTDVKALDSDYNFYWVFPYVKDGNGKMIPGGCKKYVYAKGVCPAVTNLKAASEIGQVRLTWKASAEAEGYLVYGKTAIGKYGYIGMTTKGTTYVHKSASKTEYNFYWVFPYHKDANGKMIAGGTPKYVYGKAR